MNRKGDVPGWNIIVMLILGLFGLLLIVYIAYKSKTSAFGSIDFLKDLLGF